MIEYKKGDATITQFEKTVIVHCCNDIGAWGSGFVVPLGNQFPKAKKMYKSWHIKGKLLDDTKRLIPFELGEVQFVKIGNDAFVANLIGQHNIFRYGEEIPIRYEAIRKGLKTVYEWAKANEYCVQMPKMGAGLARGDWNVIEEIINEEMSNVQTLVLLTENLDGSWRKK